jgi:hypothetical protein
MNEEKTQMPICRLCSSAVASVKAHIIPEAFFRQLKKPGDISVIVSSTLGTYRSQAPIGPYDKEILCKACESKFEDLDDYGSKVLLAKFKQIFKPITEDGAVVAFRSFEVDQDKLLRFLVSILWRASVSTRSFFACVELGPFEELAKKMILSPACPISDVFSAVLFGWRDQTSDEIVGPWREKWEDVNSYRLYMGQINAFIKVDQRPFKGPFKKYGLPSDQGTVVWQRIYAGSDDQKHVVETIQIAAQNQANSQITPRRFR